MEDFYAGAPPLQESDKQPINTYLRTVSINSIALALLRTYKYRCAANMLQIYFATNIFRDA